MCSCLLGIKYMQLSSCFVFFLSYVTKSTFRPGVTRAASMWRPISLQMQKKKKRKKLKNILSVTSSFVNISNDELYLYTRFKWNTCGTTKRIPRFSTYVGTTFHFICSVGGCGPGIFRQPFKISFSWPSFATFLFTFRWWGLQFMFVKTFF